MRGITSITATSWRCMLLAIPLIFQPCGGSDSGGTEKTSYLVDMELLTCGMNLVFERPDIPCRAVSGCEALYMPMLEAMQVYDIDQTISRAASFVATVFHETDIFRTFHQPLDDGAGALHILPDNLRVACCQIPAYETEIWGISGVRNCDSANMCGSYLCDNLADEPGCLQDSEMSSLVYNDPYMSFLTGAWFFRYGAKAVYGEHQTACEDLSEYSDLGVGEVDLVTAQALESPWQCGASTGFHRVSCCVYGGFSNTLGMEQRLRYFDAVAADFSQCDAARNASPTPVKEESSSEKSTFSKNLPYILLGAASFGALILFTRRQGVSALEIFRDTRVPQLSTGGVLVKDYKTRAELELWVEQNFPDLNTEIPDGAHCWAFEDLVIYLKTGRMPGTTQANDSFVYSDKARFSSINPLKPNEVDGIKDTPSTVAGGLAYGPLTAMSLTMSGAWPGAWPGLGGSHVMPQYPPGHGPVGYPTADGMMQRAAQGQTTPHAQHPQHSNQSIEMAPRPEYPPHGSSLMYPRSPQHPHSQPIMFSGDTSPTHPSPNTHHQLHSPYHPHYPNPNQPQPHAQQRSRPPPTEYPDGIPSNMVETHELEKAEQQLQHPELPTVSNIQGILPTNVPTRKSKAETRPANWIE